MKTLVLSLLLAGALAAPSRKPSFRRGLNKIVGGQDATPGQFPYQLSYQDIVYDEGYHYCGASIYNENWAICAGHCVQGEDFENPVNLQVVAGEHNLKLNDSTEQSVVLSKIIRHEDYNGFSFSNDISLLQLSEPLTFNSFVGPIPLQTEKEYMGECVVTGWGTLTEEGDPASVLQWVTVPTISDFDCFDAYEDDVEDSMICAGLLNGGADACQGDSGGPMACDGLLTGIVSWGYGCARPDYPGVYAEVAYFKDWVEANAV